VVILELIHAQNLDWGRSGSLASSSSNRRKVRGTLHLLPEEAYLLGTKPARGTPNY